jgi:protein gp37
MGDKTGIEWAEATWNPVTGCSKVSPGCAHCYAETVTARYAGQRGWIGEHRPWTPENAAHNVRLRPERLDQPLRWRRPRMIFVNSMSDLFHEEIPYEYVREVFNVMRRCDGSPVAATGRPSSSHTFLVLTKRPERAMELLRDRKLGFSFFQWPPHVWLGVSIENARHTLRADLLREIPAAVRFVSAEPLLGSLTQVSGAAEEDGSPKGGGRGKGPPDAGAVGGAREPIDLAGIDWLIVGGESGPGARPMHPEWARELRDACLDQRGYAVAVGTGPRDPLPGETAFFLKQLGGYPDKRGGERAVLDGRTWTEIPDASR